MPTPPVPHPEGVAETLSFHEATSRDGTRIRWWTNDVDGPVVLHCPGIGTPAYSWPGLLRPDCGVRAIGWNHRGMHGSEKPRDRRAVRAADFVDDALAVLDAAGVVAAVLAGWSIGVNTMVELARRHPERVDGLFGVAGVPGDTFASVLGSVPLPVPRWVRRSAGRGVMRGFRAASGPLTALNRRNMRSETLARVVSHSGLMLPSEDPGAQRRAIHQFLDMDIEWYMHMALELARHPASLLDDITVPVYLLAGRWDVLTGLRDQRRAALSAPLGEFHVLHGTHFLPMERPTEVTRRLREFASRAHGAATWVSGARGS